MAVNKRIKIFKKGYVRKLSLLDKLADKIASWSGSWSFLTLHIVWFGLWLIFKLDINELTLIVSLEAIILMAILLMAQNRQAEKDDMRDEADFLADVHTEEEIVELRKIINKIDGNLERLLNKNEKSDS